MISVLCNLHEISMFASCILSVFVGRRFCQVRCWLRLGSWVCKDPRRGTIGLVRPVSSAGSRVVRFSLVMSRCGSAIGMGGTDGCGLSPRCRLACEGPRRLSGELVQALVQLLWRLAAGLLMVGRGRLAKGVWLGFLVWRAWGCFVIWVSW